MWEMQWKWIFKASREFKIQKFPLPLTMLVLTGHMTYDS